MGEEKSPGGSQIYRHENAPRGEPSISHGDPEIMAAVEDHIDRCFGDDPGRIVFHELYSPDVHLDVHLVPPGQEFRINRLVTCGMAERAMSVPEGFDESPYAELTIALAPGWPLTQEAFQDERNYWPVRLLKFLGRLPHEYSTFLWYGHTIPNGDPPQAYAAGTGLCCALISAPLTAPKSFSTLELQGGRKVRFFSVVPIYEDEMTLKLEKGTDALYELFDKNNVADVVDPHRPSVVPRKRGFFRR
jgi:hypothetical protein